MNLSLKGFSQLLQDMTATLQGSAGALLDVSVGSVIRALFEANASVALWLQWLILQVLRTTRAATATGSDLDTWMNDFGLTRLPACAATGLVTFSRFTNSLPASVPIGTIVKTADTTLSFSVTADTTLSTWQVASNTYLIPAGITAATLPVICLTDGSAGNVLANTVTIIASSLPGVDQVANPAGFSNGQDAETDDAFRLRFQNYLGSLSRATLLSVESAVVAVQQNLNILVEENAAADGSVSPGSFLVMVDDGSGYPSTTLLSSVASAVEAVRPVGTTYSVIAPQVLPVNVQMTVALGSNATPSQYSSQCTTAIRQLVSAYLNGLPIGAIASVTRVAQQAYAAGAAVTNVSSLQLNGGSTDLACPPRTVIKAGQITVTVNAG
ncbi:MAG: hypothetical protein B7Z80_14200 [Rhodospirillales bacterium 20-64-7]|nr:MAG: hypothetical protein B7Z80_14200 [Rhodospirillales bacterium 20-64-7]HQT78264.1 baseplate J/gp47 family protein [Rhodopila sp.]